MTTSKDPFINSASSNPIARFHDWFQDATSQEDMPEAMSLATVDPSGAPLLRMVLLKGYDERGFVFFTNYQSAKALNLASNPHAALCLWWRKLKRQVRITGVATKIDASESDAYFQSRPRESRLGAWASDQSRIIEDREALEANYHQLQQKYQGKEIPRPPHWGGYRIKPNRIEFWREAPHRLHDRCLYQLDENGDWSTCRLQP